MSYQIDIENNSTNRLIPSQEKCEHWLSAALRHQQLKDAEVSVYLVDEKESQELNFQYRCKNNSTNVLSFPADIPEEVGTPLLGDLVICAPVVEREANEQHKTLDAHWAHMLIHGCLHLLGYDHIEDQEAELMEKTEISILHQLGFPSPYEHQNITE